MVIGAAAAGLLMYVAAAAVFYATLVVTAGHEIPTREKKTTYWYL